MLIPNLGISAKNVVKNVTGKKHRKSEISEKKNKFLCVCTQSTVHALQEPKDSYG